ncbi:hypothetical protein AK812_SmicGene37950 [Symbiodinium microadriaticum]|uniref:Uncharacterized protein n=1 Tax=Symbiodinium microadriaticum TaxID=2951 RepID=A0A1Q9CF28_SYMMI|nr:hypothetical protein AK812_SmicGene37950 [Symbiodinium microadriaticum]CAE7275278.1 unnamed protein product [Symbiodinium microadriaticum]CAE7474847.1 unnamed protein product [Symbiodinium sp. KB8]
MSAAKLEKNIANLERRLRQEFSSELDAKLELCLSRLAALEHRLEVELAQSGKGTAAIASTSHFVRVTMEDRPQMPALGHGPPQRAKGDVEVLDPTFAALDDTMDPVPFLETTWNLVLVAGHASVGWIDLVIAWLLLIASAGMQIAFCAILLTPSFLGDPFDEAQVTVAQEWRNSAAHDWKYMDLAKTSLTARVCNNDGGLILSNTQAGLVQDINNFLGLDADNFETEGFRPGILLSILCIFLWCLYVGNELRSIGLSLEAVVQIPRAERTRSHQGRFLRMSYVRFWSYCGLRVLRALIALALLYAGILWLAGTTSIEDLILNAVALGAILQVDEMIFAALMPKKLQLEIQDLEAIKVHYSRRRSQAESLLTLLLMAALLCWPWFSLLEPLGRTMEKVKKAYCAGNQDFVVALNEDLQLTVGFPTVAFADVGGKTLSQRAVEEFHLKDGEPATYILMQPDLQRFQQQRMLRLKEAAEAITSWCEDFDQFFLPGNTAPGLVGYFAPYWHSALAGQGLPENTSCEDMAHLCDVASGSPVRFVCGKTCCSGEVRNSWYKTTASGCPLRCVEESDKNPARSCVDIQTNATPAWDAFWDAYPSAVENDTGQSLFSSAVGDRTVGALITEMMQEMKAQGCPALNNSRWNREVVRNVKWCDGYEPLFAPLARLCPESCGCANLTESGDAPGGCPGFCNQVCEDATFPRFGDVATCADGEALGWCADAAFGSLCWKTCTGCT